MKILCVGAAGSGMGAIVRWHLAIGDEVYVHDDFADGAELVRKYPGAVLWNADFLKVRDGASDVGLDVAVFSDAVPASYPLRTELAARKISVRGFAEELGALCAAARRPVIAIAGTHGKSTTTALLSWIFTAAGRDPLCFIGAEIPGWPTAGAGASGFRYGVGPVIVEADEYRKHFLSLAPETVVITSLEMDHFDIYADEAELLATFVKFCTQPSVKSVFIARGQPMLDALAEAVLKIIPENNTSRIVVNRFGVENGLASNVLGAEAVSAKAGMLAEVVRAAIASFPGILRRMETLGSIGAGGVVSGSAVVTVYSDYAHHATAVRETLRRCKEKMRGAKLAVIFEPHERLRTSRLRIEYESAFVAADTIGLLPVYEPKGRERNDLPEESYQLSIPGNVTHLADYAAAIAWAKDFARENPGGVIIVMGAGPVDGAFRKVLR